MTRELRVAVLGGSGFLGRHLCTAFAADGHQVLSVSRRPGPDSVRSAQLDLTLASAEDLVALFTAEGTTTVVNAAGAVWGGPSEEDMIAANLRVVERLLEAMAQLPSVPRLVQLGTVHEYGVVPDGVRIAEDRPCQPIAPYGRTKLAATTAILDTAACGRVPGVVLRIGNVVGPGLPTASLLGGIAGKLAEAADSGTPAVLALPPMNARRDFVDVRDVAAAVVAAATAPVSGKVLNIGRGEAVDAGTLVAELVAASGVPAQRTETAATGKPAPGGAATASQLIDITAAAALLGWKPRHGLEDSMRAVWREASPPGGRKQPAGRTRRPDRTRNSMTGSDVT